MGGRKGGMETSLRLSQHVELHGTMETLTRSDAQWNVELGALCPCLMLVLRRGPNASLQTTGDARRRTNPIQSEEVRGNTSGPAALSHNMNFDPLLPGRQLGHFLFGDAQGH